MYRRKLFWFITVLIGFILQMSLSNFISVSGVFPNLLLLGTVFFALRNGPIAGEWTGFVWGLFSDAASISIFGSQTFMLTLIGYSAGRLRGKIDEEKVVAQMSLVLMMSVIFLTGLFFFEALFGGSIHRFKVMTSLFQPFYTMLVCPIAFWLLLRWDLWFHRSNSY